MEFKNEKVTAFKRYALCECGGKLVRNADENHLSTILTTSPPQYPHKCEKCGKVVNLIYISPDIVYKDVEDDKHKPCLNDDDTTSVDTNNPKDVIFINGEPYEAEVVLKAINNYSKSKDSLTIETCYRCKKKYINNDFVCDLDHRGMKITEGISLLKADKIVGDDIKLCDDCLKQLVDWLLCVENANSKLMDIGKGIRMGRIYLNSPGMEEC